MSESDIVQRLRELEAVESELACECDCPPEATANYRYAMTCAEAADTISALRARVEKLEGALREWENAVNVGVTAEGPIYIGVSSTLGQKAWKLTRAALGDTP